MVGATGDTIQAQNNLFSGAPAAAISAPGETVNATALSANAAFIQRLYEGYLQSNNTDYAAVPYQLITTVQLWLYDVKANRWDLAGSWPASGSM